MANEVKSNKIKVFPTTKRSDEADRNARLMSEQNLISIVNRLTGLKSFIIHMPSISSETNSITIPTDSEFNIGGYYFKFIDNQTITINNDTKEIGLQINTVTTGNFTELQGNDSSGKDGNYSGLTITLSTENKQVSETYLPIIRKNSNKWEIISDSKLNIIDADMLITNSLWNKLSGHSSSEEIDNSLKAFLTNIDKLVIDDGDLDQPSNS